jgi:putative SOS response-associated peptidase YedK
MCGRFVLTTPISGIQSLFLVEELFNLAPRVNIAPTQEVAAVRLGEEGKRRLAMLRWGLIPFWAKDKSIGVKAINARAEGLAEKPMFREAFQRRRCLIPADGWYEWTGPKGKRLPLRYELEGRRPVAVAGLWERWRDRAAGGQAIESCTIITTAANALAAQVHERMPVVLGPESFAEWLGQGASPAALQALLRPYPDGAAGPYGALRTVPVSPLLNNANNEDLELLTPLPAAVG